MLLSQKQKRGAILLAFALYTLIAAGCHSTAAPPPKVPQASPTDGLSKAQMMQQMQQQMKSGMNHTLAQPGGTH
jgi:hypothetical protein